MTAVDGASVLNAARGQSDAMARFLRDLIAIPAESCQEGPRCERVKTEYEDKVTHAKELSNQRRTLEGEVELLNSKLSRLKEQLMAVKTNKEYTAMLHEIQAVEDKIRSEEDKILEIMEETEGKEKDRRSGTGDAQKVCRDSGKHSQNE